MNLSDVSDKDLLQEVARRLLEGQAPLGSTRRGKPAPKKYDTKAEWAAARAVEFRNQIRETEAKQVNGDGNVRTKMEQLELMREEAGKYERMAAAYKRKGQ